MSVELPTNGYSTTGPSLDLSSGPEPKPSGLQSTVDRTQELIPTSESGNAPVKGTLMQRYISPCIGAFGSSFGLTSLLLSKIMATTNFLGFVVAMVLAVLVNYVSFIVILKLSEKYKLKSFLELSNLFDVPALKVGFKVVYFVLNFGILLSGAVAFNKLSIGIVKSFGIDSGFFGSSRTFLYIVLLHLVMFPLLMKRKLSDLKIVTILTFAACFYLTLFLVVCGIRATDGNQKISTLVTVTLDNISSIPDAFSIVFFAFSLQVNLFSMYSELPDPSIKNLKPIIFTNFAVLSSVYILLGYFGMLAVYGVYINEFGEPVEQGRAVANPVEIFVKSKSNILDLFAPTMAAAILARLLMLITSINTFLYMFKPCKDIVIEYLDDEVEAQPVGPRGTRLETPKIIKLNMYVTIGLALASVVVGSFFIIIGKELGDIIDILANVFMPVLFVFIPLAIFSRHKVTAPVVAALTFSSFCYLLYLGTAIFGSKKSN